MLADSILPSVYFILVFISSSFIYFCPISLPTFLPSIPLMLLTFSFHLFSFFFSLPLTSLHLFPSFYLSLPVSIHMLLVYSSLLLHFLLPCISFSSLSPHFPSIYFSSHIFISPLPFSSPFFSLPSFLPPPHSSSAPLASSTSILLLLSSIYTFSSFYLFTFLPPLRLSSQPSSQPSSYLCFLHSFL